MSKTIGRCLILSGLFGLTAAAAAAQTDSLSTVPPQLRRASWLSDERVFRAGDVITIVVDERVAATERNVKSATNSRSTDMDLGLQHDLAVGAPEGAVGFNTGSASRSRADGSANREGGLTAVLSVRVIGFEGANLLRIRGTRLVEVDGRKQEVSLEGLVRSEDVSPSNIVQSSRIADAMISYDGKNIGPSRGILGSILGIFWP
jgi:flagellar L-ring protein precursor FlgH